MRPRTTLLIYLSIDVLNVASVTQLRRWENILMYLKGGFFMMMKYLAVFLTVNFSFSSPPSSPSFLFFSLSPTQQQSREWSSHPCKSVCAWFCVCVCEWERESWTKHTLTDRGGGFSVSLTLVGDGRSCPDLKEQTQLRPFLTQQNNFERKRRRTKNKLFARK